MNNIYKVFISPEFSSWENKINENCGPLSGYQEDLKKLGIKQVLLSILSLKEEGMSEYQNYFNIRGIYLEHIKSLQELDNEDLNLKQEIDTLNTNSPSISTAEILNKYGILSGIEFYIPYEKMYKEYVDIMGNNVFIGSKAQYNKYYDDLICDVNYKPNTKTPFKYFDIKLAVQVVVYSKAKFKAYDITNFVSSVSTSVVKEVGGNFTIKLHLISQSDLESNNNFQDNNINIKGYNKALILQSIFRENDLVFIRFEKLQAEQDIENKMINGKYWDMIGLIDTTNIFSDYNSLNITISGRDLIKLFIEDNNLFIPLQWANNPETIFGGNDRIFKRLFATGEYNLEFTKNFKSIENSIGFILSQLTHIEVLSTACLNFLKDEYGNNLSKQFEYSVGGKQEKNETIRGIWGLINYIVDENVSHYRLADASLKNPNGSILQQILSICQEPFVEVIADTYVDKYNLIIRKPPFTIKDIYESKFLIIGRDYSISDSLDFDRNISTIYQLNPQGGCFVDNSNIPLSYLPMIVLDEYTKLWGNKLYSQVFNYINIDSYNKIEGENEKSIKENFIEELIWLVESTMYLPFSRKGTITIKGDRRIKVGQWIYYEKTNEVFYVEGINHTVDVVDGEINRTTTLNVSRGLVKDYVIPPTKNSKLTTSVNIQGGLNNVRTIKTTKKEISVSNVSYGDLVDIELLREGLKELFIKINKNWEVNKQVKINDSLQSTTSLVIPEVFNFFLSGGQFEGKIYPYVYYYDLSAVNLRDIDNIRKARGGDEGYSFSLSISEEDQDNGGTGGGNQTVNETDHGIRIPQLRRVGTDLLHYEAIYEP